MAHPTDPSGGGGMDFFGAALRVECEGRLLLLLLLLLALNFGSAMSVLRAAASSVILMDVSYPFLPRPEAASSPARSLSALLIGQ